MIELLWFPKPARSGRLTQVTSCQCGKSAGSVTDTNAVLPDGGYRWLGQRLKGCERMEPKQLYRKFIETGGHIGVKGGDIAVSFNRRSHNPVIAQAKLDRNLPPIPWLHNKRLRFEFK